MRAAPSLPWPIVIISRFLQPTIRVCDRLESLAQEIRARVSRLRHGKPFLQWFGGVLRFFVDSNHQQKSQRYARIQVFPCLAAKNELRRSETDRCGDGGSDCLLEVIGSFSRCRSAGREGRFDVGVNVKVRWAGA